MNTILSAAILFLASSSIASAECPRLEGQYWCMVGPETIDRLIVGHQVRADGVHVYSIEYANIGRGDPDYIYASPRGERDDFGWLTKCTANGHLLSLRHDGYGMGDIYVDRVRGFMRWYDGKLVQECPRKAHRRTRAAGRH